MESLRRLLGNRPYGMDYQEIDDKPSDAIHPVSSSSSIGTICGYMQSFFSICFCAPALESRTIIRADSLENEVANYISAIKSEDTARLINAVAIMHRAIKNDPAARRDCEVFYRPDGVLVRITSIDSATNLPTAYLGRGTYKVIELALKQQENGGLPKLLPVALARVTKTDVKKYSELTAGYRVHAKINHPCIIKLYEYFEHNKALYVQLEYLNGGDLLNMVLSPTEAFLKQRHRVIEHILKALKYLEGAGIRHRDIKLENFILELIDGEYTCKLSDFDWATSLAEELESYLNNKEVYGSYHYVCPQIAKLLINCRKAKKKVKEEAASSKSDVWSGGVCIFGILYGGFPPYINTKLESRLLLQEISKVSSSTITEIFKDKTQRIPQLVKRMLNPDAQQRITAKEALSIFQKKKQNKDAIMG